MKAEVIAKSLGWVVAVYAPPDAPIGTKLTLCSPSDVAEGGAYTPAESVAIYSLDNIVLLRDFLNEMLPLPAPPEVK